MVGSKCGGIGPAPDPDSRLGAVSRSDRGRVGRRLERFAPQDALEATWRLIRETNAELEATEPWKAEPGPDTTPCSASALEALRIVALLISPAMPSTSAEIWRRIGLAGAPRGRRLPADAAWGGYPGGIPVVKGEPLFPRRKA